jgi:membrane-bound serine protease (ClpP class)
MDNDGFNFENVNTDEITYSLLIVSISFVLGLLGCILLSRHIAISRKGPLARLMLTTEQSVKDGYIGTVTETESLIGMNGTAQTDLRPSGKVNINGELYDAITRGNYIKKGTSIIVKSISTNQIVVEETAEN